MARRRSGRTTRRNRRRVPPKKSRKASRRKRTTRVSSRRILQASTVKKSDTMLGSGATGADLSFYPLTGCPLTFSTGAASVNSFNTFVWSPTYRFIGPNPASYTQRGRTRTFYKGFAENCEFYLRNQSPVQWRRIVVGTNTIVQNTASYSFNDNTLYGRTQVANLSSYSALLELVLQGTAGTDWLNPMTAKTDSKRVNVMYDKLRTITPQTSSGMIRRYKMWHPYNKNFVYDDEEVAGKVPSSPYCSSEPPNENIYVIDLFYTINQNNTTDVSWATQATSYWHER